MAFFGEATVLMGLDATNLEILRLLQRDGRLPVVELARAVGRSESTVRERLANLEASGMVQGYQARVDWGVAGLPASATVRARCEFGREEEIAKHLRATPNVTGAVLTTGSKPLLVMLQVRDVAHLRQIVQERLSSLGLTEIEANLAVENLVDARAPQFPLDPAVGGPAAGIFQ